MENRNPLFETGRILKKEALEVIRDYPKDLLSILYEGYTNGVIRGLRLSYDHENRSLIIGKGLVKYNLKEFKKHWISTQSGGEEKGIAMFLEPTSAFYEKQIDEQPTEERSFKFLFGYIKKYRKYFGQIALGLLVGSLLQLILPFLTQSIVDVGIKNQNIDFIWLILLGQLMLTVSRTAIDFIRRWLLLHISLRINISLVSDFFIKLLKLPMSFSQWQVNLSQHLLRWK